MTSTTVPEETPVLDTTPAAIAAPASIAPVVANTFSITSLVMGILGIALGQPLLSIAAIVVGVIARPREPRALQTSLWGIVLGIIGTFGGVILAFLGLVAFAPLFIGGTIGGWF